MKKSLPLIALIAALAAGSAGAAGTVAGTSISNIASATFTDENGGNTTTVQSNGGTPVTTSVQAVPSFAITPNSTGTPGTAGFAPGVGNDLTVKPGDTNVTFKYTLENTGNVPNESYSLTRLSYNTGAGISNVRYYLDNPNGGVGNVGVFDPGDTLITTDKITGVAPDEKKVFFLVFDVSSASSNSQVIAVSPVGNRDANASYDGGKTFSLSDSDNYGRATVSRTDAGNLGPYNDPNADGYNSEAGAALPTSYTVTDGGTTTVVTYGPAGNRDTQTAVAPAKTTAQTVTFINSVRNSGNRADTFTLSVPDPATLDSMGFPAGSKAELLALDGSGNPTNTVITQTSSLAADPDGTGPGLGGKYSFAVRVTLPANAAPDSASATSFPSVTVKATSTNNPANSDTTTDLVRIESGVFGNETPGSPGTPAADPSLNPTKPGTPGGTVNIPMDLYNSGNVTDSYTLTGTVTFKDGNGNDLPATITYYLADANGNPTGSPVTSSTLTPGQEVKLVGQVTVPAGAVKGDATVSQKAELKNGNTTVATYTDANDTIQVGLVGGVVIKKFVDNGGANDTAYTTTPAYTDVPATYNQGSKAVPADVLRYTIFARNERNSVVKSFVLSDTVPTNTGLFSVLATYNANGSTYAGASAGAKVMYKVGAGTWTTTAPTDTTLAAGTAISVGYDWNNDNTIDAGDVLPAGAELKLVFKVKVK